MLSSVVFSHQNHNHVYEEKHLPFSFVEWLIPSLKITSTRCALLMARITPFCEPTQCVCVLDVFRKLVNRSEPG